MLGFGRVSESFVREEGSLGRAKNCVLVLSRLRQKASLEASAYFLDGFKFWGFWGLGGG